MAARRGVAWRDGRPTEPVVDAFREEGGEVLSIRQRTGELVFNVEGSVLIGTVWDSVAAGPLRQTYIGLAGTPYAARTNEDGQFRLDALPSGRYRLMLLDEDRALLGIDTLGDVRLLPADSQSVRLATPSFGAIAARICGQHPTREDSLSITYGVVADRRPGDRLPIPPSR